jgi:DNA polymerase-3 subunit beta
MKSYSIAAAGFAFTLDRKGLADALKLARRVVEKRNTIPILSTVLIRSTSPDSVEIVANDLDLMMIQELPADAPSRGAFCLDLSALEGAVKKMKGDGVAFQYMGGRVSISGGGAALQLPSLPADDFPLYGEATDAESTGFYMLAADVRDALQTVRPGVSNEETRYYLNGVHFHVTHDPALPWDAQPRAESPSGRYVDVALPNNRKRRLERDTERLERIRQYLIERKGRPTYRDVNALRLVATDGHRLFVQALPIPHGAVNMPGGVILPRKAVDLLIRLVPKGDTSNMGLSFAPARFSAAIGRIRVSGKLIDGTFPDYARVIPSQNAGRLVIADVDSFLDEFAAVAAVHGIDKAAPVSVSMSAGAFVTLHASCPQNGTAARVIAPELASYTALSEKAEEAVVGFNSVYLNASLEPFRGGGAELHTEDFGAPVLVARSGRPDVIVVQMPYRGLERLFTPSDVERLNMTPLQALAADAPDVIGALGACLDALSEATDEGAIAVLRAHVRAKRRALVALARAAFAFTGAAGRDDVKQIVRDALAGLEPVRQPDPAPEPVIPVPAPVELPKPPIQSDDVDVEMPAVDAPAAAVAPIAAVDDGSCQPAAPSGAQAPAEPDLQPVRVAKVADVYDRVYFVLASDLEDDARPSVRRVHKDGSPFCDRVAKGGGWQRIARDNIARRILPRGTTDAPAKIRGAAPAQPAGDVDVLALSAAVAALQAQMAALMAGQPIAEPAPVQPDDSALQDELAAARERIAALEAENERLRAERDAADGMAAAIGVGAERAAATVRLLRLSAKRTVRLRRVESILRADIADLGELVACVRRERDEARLDLGNAALERDAARSEAARYRIRCDALEAHAVASDRLDRRNGTAVETVLPAIAG